MYIVRLHARAAYYYSERTPVPQLSGTLCAFIHNVDEYSSTVVVVQLLPISGMTFSNTLLKTLGPAKAQSKRCCKSLALFDERIHTKENQFDNNVHNMIYFMYSTLHTLFV